MLKTVWVSAQTAGLGVSLMAYAGYKMRVAALQLCAELITAQV